ncbi:MAG: MucR family transcriptional regulator [Parvibaculaceae bacterium]|nr:MucR family transcriptional regulator [Parvibaculaceae bacterium]
MADKAELIDMTAEIVSAYVGNNSVATTEVASLIERVYSALEVASNGEEKERETESIPAVSVEDSVTDDFIVCLEDGQTFKSLKRHLRTHFDLSPEEYRRKWGLPPDYPMVAPNYAKARSRLAKKMGLGQGGRVTSTTAKTANGRARKGKR